jgi:hypothetical protein
MRLSTDPKLPQNKDIGQLVRRLFDVFRDITTQVNLITEGSIHGFHNALTSPPTSGDYRQSDYIKNSAVTELGASGSKYVVRGWVCVASGNPGIWVQDRGLTGN